jgi:hypothetical protein
MKLWCCAIICLYLGAACHAQDNIATPSIEPAEVTAPAVDPIAVHPLFGAEVPPGDYVPMSGNQRWNLFLRQTFTTPNPWLRTTISAGIAQAQGRQYSWGGGMEGYSRRYASQYATYVIRNSFLSVGAWGLKHDTRYVTSKSHNPAARIGHAILQNFLTVNSDGKTTIHVSRILSGYGAGMIATKWQPNSKWSAQGLRAGNEQLIYGGVFNIGREFSPEVDKLLKFVFRHH